MLESWNARKLRDSESGDGVRPEPEGAYSVSADILVPHVNPYRINRAIFTVWPVACPDRRVGHRQLLAVDHLLLTIKPIDDGAT